MDEKIAEVANLTLRLREMSGRVMWFENLQAEKNAETESLKKEVASLKAKFLQSGRARQRQRGLGAQEVFLRRAGTSRRNQLTCTQYLKQKLTLWMRPRYVAWSGHEASNTCASL